MKYLIKKNQIIRTEGLLPEVFEKDGQTIFGYHLLSEDDHFADGWRIEVIPEYDCMQQLGEPYYNEVIDAVVRNVIDRTDLPTIEQAKIDKISQIKDNANMMLSETDWYVVRKMESGKDIPKDVLAARDQVRSRTNAQEAEINILQSVKEVMEYMGN